MQIEELRSLRYAQPFQPFVLMLDDGREFLIEAHYYMGISPKQDLILAVTRDSGTAWFSPERIKEVKIIRKAAG